MYPSFPQFKIYPEKPLKTSKEQREAELQEKCFAPALVETGKHQQRVELWTYNLFTEVQEIRAGGLPGSSRHPVQRSKISKPQRGQGDPITM